MRREETGVPGGNPRSQVAIDLNSIHILPFVVEVNGVTDIHYASLNSQGVQHKVFYLDGHPSRYQPRPTRLNFGEQTGTCVFPLVIAAHKKRKCSNVSKKCQNKFDCLVNGCYSLNVLKCTIRLNSL